MHGPAGRVKFSCVTYLLILTYLRYFRSDLIIYFHQNYEIKVLFCMGFLFIKIHESQGSKGRQGQFQVQSGDYCW